MLSDSTVKIEPIPFQAPGELELTGIERSRDLLLAYHSTLGQPLPACSPDLPIEEICWNTRYKVQHLLGRGAQGVVYLARRDGVDGYFTNVALKVFYPNPAQSPGEYEEEMRRIALQAQRVSKIQHDSLISIRDFVALEDTRVMVLEWVDGLDLGQLLDHDRFEDLRRSLSRKTWERLNDVVVTRGENHCKLKPGIAVDILRGCLAGLSSLHHSGIVHCDLKPSNIMIKRSGTKKIIDIDSSCMPSVDPAHLRGTPYYMAPEQLQGKPSRLPSDIASLGYLLIEMLTGRRIFRSCETAPELLEAKIRLPQRLDRILPREVQEDPILSGLVSKMIALEPGDRFPDADAAELDRVGAVNFHRQLIKTNLSTEYDRELAWWIGLLKGSKQQRESFAI